MAEQGGQERRPFPACWLHLTSVCVNPKGYRVRRRPGGALDQSIPEDLVAKAYHPLLIRPARIGRNPRTGKTISVPARHRPHFTPGKELRERVNAGGCLGPSATM